MVARLRPGCRPPAATAQVCHVASRAMTRTTSAETAPPLWREVFQGARGRLTAGLLILEALVAVEILIVAAILPVVQDELQGLQLYGWNFSALTLASLGTVPIAGKLTDRLGPRSVLGAAIVIYAAGLLLAATAPTMLMLVIA